MTRLIGRREGVKYRGRFCLFVFIFRKLPEVINKRNSTLGGFFMTFLSTKLIISWRQKF